MIYSERSMAVGKKNEEVIPAFQETGEGKVGEVGARVEQEKVLFSWRGPARPFKARKDKQFMTVPVVIAGLLTLILITAGEWLLIAGVVAVVFVYYVWSTVPPQEMEYRITTRGMRMGGRLTEWWQLSRWWWSEKWGTKLLNIEMPGQVLGRMAIPVGGENAEKVGEAMAKMLLNEQPEETAMDKAGRWLAEKFPME